LTKKAVSQYKTAKRHNKKLIDINEKTIEKNAASILSNKYAITTNKEFLAQNEKRAGTIEQVIKHK